MGENIVKAIAGEVPFVLVELYPPFSLARAEIEAAPLPKKTRRNLDSEVSQWAWFGTASEAGAIAAFDQPDVTLVSAAMMPQVPKLSVLDVASINFLLYFEKVKCSVSPMDAMLIRVLISSPGIDVRLRRYTERLYV